jgi:hypothetical protein
VAAVVGSGVMASGLARDGGLERLVNAVATVLAAAVFPAARAEANPALTQLAGPCEPILERP